MATFGFLNKGTAPPYKPYIDEESYESNPQLDDALEVAILTGKPLLVTGKPGTGKTRLAYYLAQKLGQGKPFRFDTKTTSTGKDLLYTYDSLGHFQYAQNHKFKEIPADVSEEDAKNILKERFELIEKLFIDYQALGKAIKEGDKRYVVLIDEIDKAPRDLPNDILDILEEMKFNVPEIRKTFSLENAENRPILILTSNSEKTLPDAFLRRCVYLHIDFPDPERLLKILMTKFPEKDFPEDELKTVRDIFWDIRELPLMKKPATYELILWTKLLKDKGFSFKQEDGQWKDDDKQILKNSINVLVKHENDNTQVAQFIDNLD